MGIGADTQAIGTLCDRLVAMLAWEDHRLHARVPQISQWSVAQQLEHIAATGRRMLAMIALLESGAAHDGVRAKGRPSVTGRAILLTGRIPRGRAEAPEGTHPQPAPTRAELAAAVQDLVAEARARARGTGGLKAIDGVGRHPVLGWFRAPQWWRFLRIHTEHHLAIVADIDAVLLAPEGGTDPLTSPCAP